MGHLPSYLLIFFILNRVEERAEVGVIVPLPLALEIPHLSHGFIPTLHALHHLALFFSYLFRCHCYNIPHK